MNCSPYVMRRRRAIAEVMAVELDRLIGPMPRIVTDVETGMQVLLFDEPPAARSPEGASK